MWWMLVIGCGLVSGPQSAETSRAPVASPPEHVETVEPSAAAPVLADPRPKPTDAEPGAAPRTTPVPDAGSREVGPATAPTTRERAPAPEPGGDRRDPVAGGARDACRDLAETYEAMVPGECGQGTTCRWRITFDRRGYRWRVSDVVESGTFSCFMGRIRAEATAGGLARDGTVDAGMLMWEGEPYRPVREPRPVPVVPTPAPAPVDRLNPDTAPPRLATSEAHARSCTTSADCRVSTRIDGSCCRAGCGPSRAYNATFLTALEPHLDAACAGIRPQCPVVACMRQDYWPVCEAGLCVAKASPF